MSDDEKKIAIALPGEWALQKAFGPALTEIGEDLKKIYAKGRDKLVAAAYRKIDNPDDGKQANLRVTRDVLWNGAFTEDEVCAEYFGGILASSRSADGKDDDVIQFVDVIKSMSARQLRLHYTIYNRLNKLFVAAGVPVNVGQGSEIEAKQIWFAWVELTANLDLKIETDLNILRRQGLLHEYKIGTHKLTENYVLPYTMATPTTFGVLLYATALNRLEEWRTFSVKDFGDFPDVPLPAHFFTTLDELVKKAQPEPPPQSAPAQ